MKHKLSLIVLLFIFPFTSSTAQTNKNSSTKTRKSVPLDSLQMPKHILVAASSVKNKEVKSNQLQQNKVKNTAGTVNKKKQVSELNEISSAYWSTQNEIKKAKTQNDLQLLEELELNSLAQRMDYVSRFESIDASTVSAEQVKLYHSFKKDFTNE